jgi:hypothetical protein
MDNQATDTASAPNLRLAERIARQLVEQGLVGETDRALFVQNLAEGRLREGDWKAALERKGIPQGHQVKDTLSL